MYWFYIPVREQERRLAEEDSNRHAYYYMILRDADGMVAVFRCIKDTDDWLYIPVFGQERRLVLEGGNHNAPAAYYMPVKGADAMVAAFRAWLNRFAGGAVEFPSYVEPALPRTPDKAEMLDRWV